MIKYVISAITLKGFSSFPLTKKIYRAIGNTVGANMRIKHKMPKYYFKRVNRMLQYSKKYNIPKDGDNILELGTGWLHWEGITSRMFFDLKGVLFDVWDNRQMGCLKNYITQLDYMLDKLDADDTQRDRARQLIVEIKNVKTFSDLYKLLGFTYIVDPSGLLKKLENNSFDYVVSAGVMEHVPANIASDFVKNIENVLKPGGYSFHSINLRDHLYAYDKNVSVKQYLKYSDSTWKRWFENEVQYINRIQRKNWLEIFQNAGLLRIEEDMEFEDISDLQVSSIYQHLGEADLGCCGLRLLHRKPYKI